MDIGRDIWTTFFCACTRYNNSFRQLIINIFICTLLDGSTDSLHHKNNRNIKQNQHNIYYTFQIKKYSHIPHITLSCISYDFPTPLLTHLQILSFVFPTSSKTHQLFLFSLVRCFFWMDQEYSQDDSISNTTDVPTKILCYDCFY